MNTIDCKNPQYMVTYILASRDPRNSWSCVEYCLDAPQLVPQGQLLYDREVNAF